MVVSSYAAARPELLVECGPSNSALEWMLIDTVEAGVARHRGCTHPSTPDRTTRPTSHGRETRVQGGTIRTEVAPRRPALTARPERQAAQATKDPRSQTPDRSPGQTPPRPESWVAMSIGARAVERPANPTLSIGAANRRGAQTDAASSTEAGRVAARGHRDARRSRFPQCGHLWSPFARARPG